jgi:hypothetical protein
MQDVPVGKVVEVSSPLSSMHSGLHLSRLDPPFSSTAGRKVALLVLKTILTSYDNFTSPEVHDSLTALNFSSVLKA